MGKLGYFFTTLVGAVPAGLGLFLLIKNFLDRADKLGTMLMVITIIATVCMALVALTPFMVLVFYKDTRPKLAAAGAGAAAAGGAVAGSRDEGDGFGDAIPDDFDEDELRASEADDYDDGSFEDDDALDDDADYDEDFEDLDF